MSDWDERHKNFTALDWADGPAPTGSEHPTSPAGCPVCGEPACAHCPICRSDLPHHHGSEAGAYQHAADLVAKLFYNHFHNVGGVYLLSTRGDEVVEMLRRIGHAVSASPAPSPRDCRRR